MSLTSKSEFEAVSNAIRDASDHWIGLTDQYFDGDFIWTDATPYATGLYANWAASEPGGGTAQNCVAILSDLLWHDAPCTELRPYLCEKGF